MDMNDFENFNADDLILALAKANTELITETTGGDQITSITASSSLFSL